MRGKASHSSPQSGGFVLPSRQRKAAVQAKLQVNKPGDQYEVEADKAADQVVGNSMGSQLDTVSSTPGSGFGKPLPISIRPSSGVQAKEEEVQAMEEEVQAKEEEAPASDGQALVQAQEEQVQAKEEEVQAKEVDIATAGMNEEMGEEDPIRSEAVQAKEDEVQAKEEEAPASDGQASVQAQEEEAPASDGQTSVQAQEEDVQAKRFTNVPTSQPVTPVKRLSSTKGGGSKLPTPVKAEMEAGFGTDFSDVRIHTGTAAESMSKEIGAQAFTHKSDIYFNQGKFNPNSKDGKRLLAHELTHTIQQGAVANAAPSEAKEAAIEKEEAGATQTPSGSTRASSTPSTAAGPAAQNGSANRTAVEAPAVDAPVEPTQEAAAESEQVAEEEEMPVVIRNPYEDPAFNAVRSDVDAEADQQEEHESADVLSADAQEAAESPDNERESIAEAAQVEEMDEEEPGEFSADAFKAKLMERIESMKMPANEEEADEFETNNNLDEVNQQALGDVSAERTQAAGPIEQTSQAPPNTDAVPQRETTPLPPPDYGPTPQPINTAGAVPPPRSDLEVSAPLQRDSESIDQRMADNKVTDEQLARSEEPKFIEALDSKETAQENAATAPQQFRAQEGGIRTTSEQNVNAQTQNELQGMHAIRGTAMDQVLGNQQATGQKDTSERTRIADEINAIYDKTKTDVEDILNTLEEDVTKKFEMATKIAKYKFEKYVALEMYYYKEERYGGALGWARAIGDVFTGLPDEVNQFFVDGRQVFIDTMDEYITKIAQLVATELNRAKDRINQGKQEVADYVDALPSNLKSLGREAAENIEDKFSQLQDDVNSKQEDLIDSMAQQYMDALNEVDERIEEMKAANRGLIDMALDFVNGVIETILKLKEMIEKLLSAIMSVIDVIMEDPIGFMKNLFDGIGKGIDAFKANIQQHLLGGLLEWLTGSLGPMGITLPEDIFSLKGIFNLVLQVLGLGWDYIRKKAVMMMGEPVVAALEKGYDMFTTFSREGIDGIWEYMKDQFGDLKETVIEAIKSMLITKVIEAGIKWLLSLLIPGAGFIKAIMAIKDLIVFFVESAIMLIPAITEAILALAAGSVAGVAKAIEFGLAKLIALVINLFAKLIGLGGLSKKVTAIFKKIRKRVDSAVMKLLRKAKAKGRQLMSKIGGKKKPANKEEHDMQVKAGMRYLHQQEKTLDSDSNKALTEAEAKKVAARTKKKFPVFTSITPRQVGGKWVYDWTGSKDTEEGDSSVEETKKHGDNQKCSNQYLEEIQKEKTKLKNAINFPFVDPKKALDIIINNEKKLKGSAKNTNPENVRQYRQARQNLLDLRIKEQKECFYKTDDVHQDQIDAERNAIAHCDKFLEYVASMDDDKKLKYFGST